MGMTLAQLVTNVTEKLTHAGTPYSAEQAQWLVAQLLNYQRFDFVLYPHRIVDEDCEKKVWSAAQRLIAGEPLAYIVGTCCFDDMSLVVGPGVLIPRPETELLVERVLDKLAKRRADRNFYKGLDLGTGSGCLVCALARRTKTFKEKWQWMASDISQEALAIACKNIEKYAPEVQLRQGSWLDPWQGEQFDVVVCNPPYIAHDEEPYMSLQTLEFEPHRALFAGLDGLDSYRYLAENLHRFLRPKALVALEIGWRQAELVKEIFFSCGWGSGTIELDLSAHPRFFFIERE